MYFSASGYQRSHEVHQTCGHESLRSWTVWGLITGVSVRTMPRGGDAHISGPAEVPCVCVSVCINNIQYLEDIKLVTDIQKGLVN